MEASTRRAFALDSRTVWVEQQLVNSVLVPRDNLVLGPGEYNAKVLDRHVSTPSLGGPRRGIDFMPSFQSDIQSRSPSGKGSPSRARSPNKAVNRIELRDFSTTFHDHDTRLPFDPKNGYCPTPGSYLAHSPALKMVRHDGVFEPKGAVPFGPNDATDRIPTRLALPDYDPKFDSPQVRPATTLGSFPKSKRIYIPSRGDPKPTSEDSFFAGPKERSPTRSPQRTNGYVPGEPKMSVFQMRCSLVRMPKLKHRSPPVLVFDASSYKDERINKPLNLHPKLVNSKAQVRMYDKLAAIPRKHLSTSVLASQGQLVVRPADDYSEDS